MSQLDHASFTRKASTDYQKTSAPAGSRARHSTALTSSGPVAQGCVQLTVAERPSRHCEPAKRQTWLAREARRALGSLSPAGGSVAAHGAHGWCRYMGVLRADARSAPRRLRWQRCPGCGPPRTLAPRARSRGAKERHGRGSGEDAVAAAGADGGGGAATEPAAADMERHGRHRRHRVRLRPQPRQRRRRRKGAKQVQSDSDGTAAACPARGCAARVHKRRGPGQHPTRE